MSKKAPKLGDQIVDLPTETVVQDPPPATVNLTEQAAAGGDINAILQQLEAEEAAAAPAPQETPAPPAPAPEPPLPVPPAGPTILLENGGRVSIEHSNNPPAYQITGRDDLTYYHTSDDPVTGEWRYRYIP